MKKSFIIIMVLLVFAGMALAQTGVKKKRPLPYDFGKVVIGKYSVQSGLSPVSFDHWLHRAKFTCRLCHVDLGFAMKANDTGIRAADNMEGYYCGACHNGKTFLNGKLIFSSCAKPYFPDDIKKCERCHSEGKRVQRDYSFSVFTEKLPKERFGNGIDWEKAEEKGLIKPIDFLEGVSIQRPPLDTQKDFLLESNMADMPEIIFSHKKHTVWNGCEVCHPELFLGVKKGTTKYTMVEIYEGRFCGACHGSVAFPLFDCQRCHTKQVS